MTLTVLVSLVFLADILSLWRKGCTFITFGIITLHIGLLPQRSTIASLSALLYLDNIKTIVSVDVRDRSCMTVFFSAWHQIGPAQQLQLWILSRFTNFTRWWQLPSTASDRGCSYLTTQCRKGEVVIFRWILSTMRTLNLLQVLIKLWTWGCHRRWWSDDGWRAANYRVLFATVLNLSQFQVQLIDQTDNVWFLNEKRKRDD